MYKHTSKVGFMSSDVARPRDRRPYDSKLQGHDSSASGASHQAVDGGKLGNAISCYLVIDFTCSFYNLAEFGNLRARSALLGIINFIGGEVRRH